MQALNFKLEPFKVTIPGQYYDSQIHNGKLYLWKIDGSILILNWDKLIDNLDLVPERLKITLQFALQSGEDLYHNLLLKDNSHRKLILKKFQKLAELQIEIPSSSLTQFKVTEKDNPLPFPHADSAVHDKALYIGSQSGVSASYLINFNEKESSCTHIEKISDVPVFSLSASHNMLAFGGSEGLFEYSLLNSKISIYVSDVNSFTKIHDKPSNFVRWFYPNIFSSCYEEGFFANIQLKKHKNITSNREIKKVVSINKIFTNIDKSEPTLLTWGVFDKICLLKKNSIDLVKYIYREKNFVDLGSVDTQEPIGDIISADSSFFGIVIEQEDGLLIITSSLDYIKLPGEPVNWRVFPQSKYYTNQLHVIYEDYLHIYSFNHDFFINQDDKKIGMSWDRYSNPKAIILS